MNFDRLAPFYRGMEFVLAGGVLQRMRSRWVTEIPRRARILVAGEGHGRGLEALLRGGCEAEITVVEQSVRMVAVAKRRLQELGLATDRITWVDADVRQWCGPSRYFDVIVTQFFLDCFDARGVDSVVARLERAAKIEAMWLLCDFRVPASGWRRVRATVIHRMMYGFFRALCDLEAARWSCPERALRKAGFDLTGRTLACGSLIHSDLWVRPRACGKGIHPEPEHA